VTPLRDEQLAIRLALRHQVGAMAHGRFVEMVAGQPFVYVVKGQIAVDKVVMWIEREDNAEPVTAPVAVRRFQNRPTGTIYVPVIVPK
jgi:hypothetical protein